MQPHTSARLGAAIESSRAVGFARTVTAGSRVWRAMRIVTRPLIRTIRGPLMFAIRSLDRLQADVAARPSLADHAAVPAVIGRSWLVVSVERLVGRAVSSWQASESSRLMRLAARRVGTLERWQRVRALGLLVLVAGTTHAILLWIAPTPSTIPPFLVTALITAVGVALMLGCRPLAAAWALRFGGKRI